MIDWILGILFLAATFLWALDSRKLREDAAHFEALYCSAEKELRDERTKMERLIKENSRLQAENMSPYKIVKVRTEEKKVIPIGITVEIPENIGIDEYVYEARPMFERELWEIMRPRAIVEGTPNYENRTITTRFRWFVNAEGEILDRDSFLWKSHN